MILAVICFIPQTVVGQTKDFRFTLTEGGESVAELNASAPSASWASKGDEAAVARPTLDDQYVQPGCDYLWK